MNGESDAITNAVEGFQNDVLVALSDNWQLAALVLGGVVAAAVVYVTFRRRPTPGPSVASPPRERSLR